MPCVTISGSSLPCQTTQGRISEIWCTQTGPRNCCLKIGTCSPRHTNQSIEKMNQNREVERAYYWTAPRYTCDSCRANAHQSCSRSGRVAPPGRNRHGPLKQLAPNSRPFPSACPFTALPFAVQCSQVLASCFVNPVYNLRRPTHRRRLTQLTAHALPFVSKDPILSPILAHNVFQFRVSPTPSTPLQTDPSSSSHPPPPSTPAGTAIFFFVHHS